MTRPSRAAIVLTLAAGAAWFAFGRTGLAPFDALTGARPFAPADVTSDFRYPAFDVYAHFVPIMEYAGHALRNGGRGLWWTPLQNCGQPFWAFNGLLYPLHWLPAIFGIDAGLRLLIAANLLLGGGFAYLLGRELGARPSAALTGALAFQLGNAAAQTAAWTPLVLEPLMWFPAVFLCVERLLRAPSIRWTVALAFACCATMLPAWPQLVLFLYQLVGLRLLWVLVVERPPRLAASLAAIAAGLVLGPLLDGVQLVPALEVARDSVRRATLAEVEIAGTPFDWRAFRVSVTSGRTYGQPFTVAVCVLASLALVGARTRGVALFHFVAGAIFFALALGPDTPLLGLYQHLPAGRMFREPARFVWVTGFCLGVLTTLGAEALASFADHPATPTTRLARVLAVLGVLMLAVAAGWGQRPLDIGAGATIAVLVVLATSAPQWARIAPRVVPGLAVATLVVVPVTGLHYLYPTSASLFANADLFARLRARTGSTARAYLTADDSPASRIAFMAKSASLFDVPVVADYEPQTSRRFADFLVRLRQGGPMWSLNAYYYATEGSLAPGFNRNLLDLTAGRFLVVDTPQEAAVTQRLSPPPPLRDEQNGLRVYENASAVPRAHWVGRVEVFPKQAALLQRLVTRYYDPWRVALLEAPPASGFLGTPPDPNGALPPRATVTFVRDDPESIAIAVDAPARGFLVVADQYHEGWRATVNGAPAEVLRANYVFRAVEVPGGRSQLTFEYRPWSWTLGLLVSGGALLVAGGALLVATRRRRGETPAGAGSIP